MLTPFDLVLLALAAVAWPLSLFRPGWTRALRRAAARHRWSWVAVAAGLLLVALADPVLPRMPGRAAADAWAGLFRPELGRRLTAPVAGVLLLALPLLADARLAPGGLPALAPAARRLALTGCAWLGIALAPLLIARSAPAVWASTLGGEMHPSLRALLVVASGADPAGAGRSVPDAGLPALLWLMAAGAVLALAGQRLTAARWPSAPARIALAWGWGLLAGLAGWALRAAAPEPAAAVAVPAFGAAAVALWAVSRRRGLDGSGELLWRLALTGVVLLAFQLRWGFLVQNPGWGIPLSMDAQSYYDEGLYLDRLLVDRRTNLFALFFSGSTYFREPLFVYLMHNWLHLVGAQEIHAVYLTVLASTVWVGVSAVAVRLLLGRGAGLLAALLLAIDAVWYRNAAVGLREEVTGVLLGLLLIVLWAARSGRWGLYWLAPFLAGAAAVTRLDALPFALFILVWAAVAQRWPLRRAVAVLGLLAVVLVPTLAGYGRSRGDVAPASTEIATNNWREVFKDRLGQPGFEPDRRVTATEFVFRYFTPPQWVRYTLGGYARIYGEEVFVSHYYLLANGTAGWGRYLGLHSYRFVPLLFLAGTVGLLFQWRRWRRTWLVPALCIVGVMPPIGFVAGVPGHPALYQARYAYMVAPFAAATVAWALVAGGGWLAGRLARVRALDRPVSAPAQPANGAQPAQPAEGGERAVAWHYVGARDADAPLPVRLLGVWRHRRLLKRMAERELRQRYIGSALGLAWTALSPLIFVTVYVVIFTFVFGARLNPGAPTAEYALYVLAGLLPWVAFSEVASRSTQTMAEHRNLVKFVVFPVQILPLTSLYVVAFSQAIGLLVLVLLATWLHGGPPPGLWLLPAVLVLQAIFLAGVAWLLGALGAVLRDVKEVVQVALMVGMFLTPIFYLERDLPRPLRLIVELNPLAHLARLYRDALLGAGIEHALSLPVFAAFAAVTLLVGFLTFERTRVFLSDIL